MLFAFDLWGLLFVAVFLVGVLCLFPIVLRFYCDSAISFLFCLTLHGVAIIVGISAFVDVFDFMFVLCLDLYGLVLFVAVFSWVN